MKFRTPTTYLLITTFLTQSCLPAFANWDDIAEVEKNTGLLKHGAVPARLDFKADSEQTAAGCLFYAQRDNKIEILLGLRDDENSYCNPGGKSDKQDGTLEITGDREGAEETLNIYCPHPEILKKQPFVDLYSLKEDKKSQQQEGSLKPFLNRMYFVEQEHVDEKHFNDRLKNAASLKLSHHQQEYRSFTWVPVEDLLKAVQNKNSTFIASNSALEINLFGPLFQTLLTDTAQSLLQHLVTNKTIPQFSSKEKPLIKNQLHLEGVPTIQEPPKISWPLPEVDYEQLAKEATRNAEINLEVKDIALSDSKIKETTEETFKRIYRKKDVEREGRDTLENVIFPRLKHETISFDQDAFGREVQERIVKFATSTQVQQTTQDPVKNRILFGRAVAAKAAADLEIKNRFNEGPDIEKQSKQLAALKQTDQEYFEKNQLLIATSKEEDREEKGEKYFSKSSDLIQSEKSKINIEVPYNLEEDLDKRYFPQEPQQAQLDIFDMMVLREDAPILSDLLLQVQLGADYVKPTNPHDPHSRREADLLNLKQYNKQYGDTGEFKRDADPLDTDFERIASLYEIERQHRGWIPIQHASKPEVKHFWVANTHRRELLTIKPVEKGSNPAMRATDIYYRGHNNIKESVEKTGVSDYEMGNESRRLSGNMAITSGLQTTHTSSSSVEYFFNSHSVRTPATLKRFEESIQLLGMIDTSYLPYQSLYEQYFGLVSKDIPNSAWTVLLINPDILDTYSYPAHGGGKFFNPDFPTKEEGSMKGMQSSIALYERARRDLLDKIQVREMSILSTPEPNSTQNFTGRLVESIAEIRFLLHPSIMFNSRKAKVFSVDRFPPLEAKKKKFEMQSTAINVNDIGRWLASHTKIMPDSFQETPSIKKLYAFAHEGLTGERVIETTSADAFPHLVKNGHHEGAKQFFESYPEIIKKLNLTPHELTLLAINSGSMDTLKFMLGDVLKTTIGEIFTKDDIVGLMKACIMKGNILDTQTHVFQNYDLKAIDESIKRAWGVDILAHANAETISAFHQHILPITPGIVDEAIQKSLFFNDHKKWKGLIKSKEISKSHLAENFLKYFTPEHITAAYSIETALKGLIQEGLSYTELLPTSGNPLLFFIPYFIYLNLGDNEGQHLLDTLVKDPLLLDYKNQEGLTLMPFLQKNFLKGQTISGYNFKKDVLSKHLETRGNQSFYPPFLEEFGPLDLCNPSCILSSSPFADPLFQKWHQGLEKAVREDSLPQIIEAWKQIPNPDHLDLYKLKNPREYLSLKFSKCSPSESSSYNFEKGEIFKNDLHLLLLKEKYHDLFPVIDAAFEAGVASHLLGTLNTIPSFWEIQKERQNQLIPYYKIPELLSKPVEFLSALQANEITQSAFIKAAYSFNNENADLIEKALPILFPNSLELVTQKDEYGRNIFEGKVQTMPYPEKLVKILLEYGGCVPLLSHLDEQKYSQFLHVSSAKLLNFIAEESPNIFAYQDEKRDFLKISIDFKKFQNIQFMTAHLKKLKETYSEDGIPLIFLLDSSLLMQVISEEPSILDLKTKEGLDVETLLAHFIPQDSEAYEQATQLLAYYKSQKK